MLVRTSAQPAKVGFSRFNSESRESCRQPPNSLTIAARSPLRCDPHVPARIPATSAPRLHTRLPPSTIVPPAAQSSALSRQSQPARLAPSSPHPHNARAGNTPSQVPIPFPTRPPHQVAAISPAAQSPLRIFLDRTTPCPALQTPAHAPDQPASPSLARFAPPQISFA